MVFQEGERKTGLSREEDGKNRFVSGYRLSDTVTGGKVDLFGAGSRCGTFKRTSRGTEI
jgi:hypothetical protein